MESREENKTDKVDLGNLYRMRANRSSNSSRVDDSTAAAGATSSIDMLRGENTQSPLINNIHESNQIPST